MQFTRDGSRVLYIAGQEQSKGAHICRVSPNGGASVQVDHLEGTSAAVTSFRITPEGSRVVYTTQGSGGQGLDSIPINGGDPVSYPEYAGQILDQYAVTNDGMRVIYSGNRVNPSVTELFSERIESGTHVTLNDPFPTGGDIQSFAVSADGDDVVYLADQNADELFELFSIDSDGNTNGPTKISGTQVANGDVLNYQLTPDSARVVYLADQSIDQVNELFSVGIFSSTPTKLHPAQPAGRNVTAYAITPDSSRVVFRADHSTDEVFELFSVPVAGGTPIKLNSALPLNGDVNFFQITPDGSRVVYVADQLTDGVSEMFVVPITGGTPLKLSGAMVSGGNSGSFVIDPDSSRVLYIADQITDGMNELFCVPLTGGPALKINSALQPNGDVSDPRFSPDGGRFMYRADKFVDGRLELFIGRGVEHWAAGGGSWDAAANWEFNVAPDLTTDVVIDAPAAISITGGSTSRRVDTLTVGGGSATSMLELRSDASLTVLNGMSILNRGVVRGDGVVTTGIFPLSVPAGAELGASAGEVLRLTSGAVTNAGSIQALGGNFAPAEIDFSAAVTNQGSTGFITGHDSVLRFRSNLTNAGSLTLSRGVNDVLGEITNQATGRIVVSGGAVALFYDDVVNSGSI